MSSLATRSFLNASGTAVYIAGVATIMRNAERIFGEMNQITAPIAILMLFVLSAAVTGGLVLGKPALLYFNNQKREAVTLFIYTVCWLALGTAVLLATSFYN